MGGFTNAFPPVIAVYFASSTKIPVWPWFPPPRLDGVVAAIAHQYFLYLYLVMPVQLAGQKFWKLAPFGFPLLFPL